MIEYLLLNYAQRNCNCVQEVPVASAIIIEPHQSKFGESKVHVRIISNPKPKLSSQCPRQQLYQELKIIPIGYNQILVYCIKNWNVAILYLSDSLLLLPLFKYSF